MGRYRGRRPCPATAVGLRRLTVGVLFVACFMFHLGLRSRKAPFHLFHPIGLPTDFGLLRPYTDRFRCEDFFCHFDDHVNQRPQLFRRRQPSGWQLGRNCSSVDAGGLSLVTSNADLPMDRQMQPLICALKHWQEVFESSFASGRRQMCVRGAWKWRFTRRQPCICTAHVRGWASVVPSCGPGWAFDAGDAATHGQVQEAHAVIRDLPAYPDVAADVRIQHDGSASPGNCGELSG